MSQLKGLLNLNITLKERVWKIWKILSKVESFKVIFLTILNFEKKKIQNKLIRHCIKINNTYIRNIVEEERERKQESESSGESDSSLFLMYKFQIRRGVKKE